MLGSLRAPELHPFFKITRGKFPAHILAKGLNLQPRKMVEFAAIDETWPRGFSHLLICLFAYAYLMTSHPRLLLFQGTSWCHDITNKGKSAQWSRFLPFRMPPLSAYMLRKPLSFIKLQLRSGNVDSDNYSYSLPTQYPPNSYQSTGYLTIPDFNTHNGRLQAEFGDTQT